MRTNLFCKILTIVGLGSLFGCSQTKNYTDNERMISFEEQLSIYSNLGFQFNEGVTQEDLLNMWGKEEFERNPFSQMYISLGSQIEREPWTPITNQCWHFDTEAIEDQGAYVDIIHNLERISNGMLSFEDVTDIVDSENEKASISFKLNGDTYNWDLEFDNDWVDPVLFSKIVELTNKYNTKEKFTYYSTGGQDLVIGWATKDQLNLLKEKTGLDIIWLE